MKLAALLIGVIPLAPALAVEPVVLRALLPTGDDDAPQVELYHVSWAPDGKTVIAEGYFTASQQRGGGFYVFFWDVATRRVRMRIGPLQDAIANPYRRTVHFRGDGSQFLLQGRNEVFFYDTATGKRLSKLAASEGYWYFVAVSPDGKMMAVRKDEWEGGSVKEIEVLELPSGRKKAGWAPGDNVTDIAFTPDGKYLAVAREALLIKLYDTKTWQRLGATEKSLEIEMLILSPDGTTIASMQPRDPIVLWHAPQLEVSQWRPQYLYYHNQEWRELEPEAAAFSPDGRYLAASYYDYHAGMLGFWPSGSAQPAVAIPTNAIKVEEVERSIAFAPDGAWLATIGNGGNVVRLWDWRAVLQAGK
jgi:WD40 repeat protein